MSTDSTNYRVGMRTYLASHSPDQFLDLLKNKETNKYYSFHIYQPTSSKDSSDLIGEYCDYEGAGIKRIYTGSVIVIQATDNCLWGRVFGVSVNGQSYKIQGGTDAMNYDLIWELLKTAKPIE